MVPLAQAVAPRMREAWLKRVSHLAHDCGLHRATQGEAMTESVLEGRSTIVYEVSRNMCV